MKRYQQQPTNYKSTIIVLFTLLLLTTIANKTKAQGNNYITFDTAFTNLYIDTTNPNNSWQIGSPHKVLFDSARTRPFAIVTDTVNYYPINDTSSFIIKINKPTEWISGSTWVNSTYGPTPFVTFVSKIDMDSLTDKGYVEYSLDNGANWLLVNGFSFTGNDYPPYYTQGNPLFTGTWNNWFYTNIYLGGNNPASGIENVDSVLFKFTFVSDSINTNKEGWIIDDIDCGTISIVGVNETENNDINIYPNPVSSEFILNTSQENLNNNYKIVNLLGEVVLQSQIQQLKTTISINHLPNGVYFLQIVDDKQMISKKIIKE